jgi:hypothetical protein
MEEEDDEDTEPISKQRTLYSCGVRRHSDMTRDEFMASGLASIRSSTTAPTKSQRPSSRDKRSKPVNLYPPDGFEPRTRGRPSTYTKWWVPELGGPILRAMKESQDIRSCIERLRRRHKSGLNSKSPFDKLSRSNMSRWCIKKGCSLSLTANGKRYFEQQSSYAYERSNGILKNPRVIEELKAVVERLRSSGKFIFL